jgi:arylsulfatase A-like enzyme
VLFLSLDDCNDWVGFLRNHPGTHTPNLDALAARSLSFTGAYTTAPMCKPARNSVLFGRHPYESGVYDHEPASARPHRRLMQETPSLVDDFWAAGYAALGAGKVFGDGQSLRWTRYRRAHHYLDAASKGPFDRPERFDPTWRSPYDGRRLGDAADFTTSMVDFGPSGREPEQDPDGATGAWVRQRLLNDLRRPTFVGYGLVSTHVPWRVSQRFFDLHPLEEVVLPEVDRLSAARLPAFARESVVDVFGAFERLVESGRWAHAVRAYQAAMSAMDHHVGQVLDALASSPRADDTVVVLWSDHGFHLGEKLHLHKFTLWEEATRVPFLLHVPGRFDRGTTYDEPVSMIDLGPTLAELCGIPITAAHSGTSLLRQVEQPEQAAPRPAITTWQEGNHAVRLGPWRYIRYRNGETELYDHRSDPREHRNLSGSPQHRSIEAQLDRALPPASGERFSTAPPTVAAALA